MHSQSLETAVRRIRSLTAPAPDGVSDNDLLGRFLTTRDESAFAALVARHGPMVFGVCRRVLADRHTAEDAFQATFLVLARRASAIRRTASLGYWLHGVAFRVANKLKARLARQPRSASLPDLPADSRDDVSWRDVRRILDEEVSRLPERLRLPILLCYFEGKTRDEAAEALGCRLSTLRGRLEDGRERLKARLARRGVELSAALLAVSTAEAMAVEDSLIASAVRAATGSAPHLVQSLAKGVAMSGVTGKLKLWAGALLLAVGLGTTVLVYRGEAGEAPAPNPAQKVIEAPAKSAERPPAKEKDLPEPVEVPRVLDIKTLALGADRIWIVPSPTRDKPVPIPDDVLKGPPVDRPSVSDLGSLPVGDATKKWIVFLQAVEHYVGVPKLKPWPATQWYIPYDEASVAVIREALLPADWGAEQDALRMGLRLRDNIVPAGNPVVAEVVIRNSGNNDRTIKQHRLNIYDYWPGTRFEVTIPDGSKWLLSKSSGPMDESDALREFTLKPGGIYVHAIRLDRWYAGREEPNGDTHLPNLFTKPGDYSITCRHAATPVIGLAGWEAGRVSNAVTLTMTKAEPKPGAWGEAVDGMRARVRMSDGPIAAGGPLVFDLDLKNEGNKVRDVPAYGVLCDVDIDGVRYAYPEKYDIKGNSRRFEPGEEMAPFVSVGAEMWRKAQPKRGEPAGIADALTPGRHKLVASFRLNDTTRVNSPMVEFEVKPEEWGEASGGIKARLRLAKATFRTGEPLAFELDLKNTGDKTYEDGPIPFHCRIELDGAEYQYTAPISYTTSIQTLKPGKEFIPYVKVKTDEWWMRSRGKPDGTAEAVRLVLMPGKHKVRVAYPLVAKEMVIPVSEVVEFEVTADEVVAPELPTLVDRADRIVVATIDWKLGEPRIKPVRTLKGPNNRSEPDAQPLHVPVGMEPLPGGMSEKELILFLKAEEDGVELAKLSPAAARGWYRESNAKELQAILAALPKLANSGVSDSGLVLGIRPTPGTIRVGEEVRLDVRLMYGDKGSIRLLQHRYHVYDYWPFLTFEVTCPDGRVIELRKPEGQFKREDFIDEITLAEGQSYTHIVRLDRWPNALHGRVAGPILADPFRATGTYKIQATYNAPVGFKNLRPGLEVKEWPFWSGEIKSNEVTIEVK